MADGLREQIKMRRFGRSSISEGEMMEELINTENMENTVIPYTDYQAYKADLDAELARSAESFVRIGYLLKAARDTNILKDSGYENVNDFAKAEYGLDKTQVSRFIRINDRFSEYGYSERLKAEYRNFGYAKLALMLTMPDNVNEIITPEYSKAEIQMLKDEVDAEAARSDIEVMLEEKDPVQQGADMIEAPEEQTVLEEMPVQQEGAEDETSVEENGIVGEAGSVEPVDEDTEDIPETPESDTEDAGALDERRKKQIRELEEKIKYWRGSCGAKEVSLRYRISRGAWNNVVETAMSIAEQAEKIVNLQNEIKDVRGNFQMNLIDMVHPEEIEEPEEPEGQQDEAADE